MKLRFSIPLVVAIVIVTTWLSGVVGFNVYYVAVALSAVWLAVDSRSIDIRAYRTQFALPPLALAALTIVAWPLALPAYLKTRDNITSGKLERGEFVSNARPLVWLFGILGVLVVIGFVATRGIRETLMPVLVELNRDFPIPMNLSISDKEVAITIPKAAVADSVREAVSREIASCVKHLYAKPIGKVSVKYPDVEQRGAVTITREGPSYSWPADSLTASCPAAPRNFVGIPKPSV